MIKKPVIAFVESESRRVFEDDNPDRDALAYFLREHCGCTVLIYRHDDNLRDDLLKLKELYELNQLILVIVKQLEYYDQHTPVIQVVRQNFSADFPIVVIPEGWEGDRFKGVDGDDRIYIFDHFDTGLIDLVKDLVSKSKPVQGWLGADNNDYVTLQEQLNTAYQSHATDESVLGTASLNDMTVAEALRIRLLPSELIEEEFDKTLEPKEKKEIVIEPGTYKEDFEKIRTMDNNARKSFFLSLMRARGEEPGPGGVGVFVVGIGLGDNVNGFAIDPITLESLTTYRFGLHNYAGDLLGHRVIGIEALKKREHSYDTEEEDIWDIKRRLITGLVFLEISGFTTPILQLFDLKGVETRYIKKVAEFIIRQQKFIPVDYDCKLVC